MTTAEKLVRAFDIVKEIHAIARERVGTVPGRRVEVPKTRKPVKHKKRREALEKLAAYDREIGI